VAFNNHNLYMKIHYRFVLINALILSFSAKAQVQKLITEADKTALEGIIIEKYSTANSIGFIDTTGGALPKDAVTYRIYVDMKPGYSLQAVYGVPNHELIIKTSTHFYNNIRWGNITGDKIDDVKITNNTAAFDSYITLGAATDEHNGVPLSDDKDGSILKIKSFEKADGLKAEKIKPIVFFGFDLSFFNNPFNAASFSGNNGSWAVFGGIKGSTPENKVLIAQLTTDGKLNFELNIQMGTPTGGTLNFVAKNPAENEISYAALKN